MRSKRLRADQVEGIASDCGPLRVLSNKSDSKLVKVSHLEAINKGRPHFHKEIVEFYYVLSGFGYIRIAEKGGQPQDFPADQGAFFIVRPGDIHQVRPLRGGLLEILVVSASTWRQEDELYLSVEDEAKFDQTLA